MFRFFIFICFYVLFCKLGFVLPPSQFAFQEVKKWFVRQTFACQGGLLSLVSPWFPIVSVVVIALLVTVSGLAFGRVSEHKTVNQH
jgi:hypothetical protein